MPASLVVVLLVILACCVAMVALFVAAWRRTLAEVDASGLVYRMRCERCGAEFDLAPRDFARPGARRARSTTRTRAKGVALVSQPRYHYVAKRLACPAYVAKRLACPACGERTWCENLNANEAQDVVTPIALRNFGGALLVMVVVGFVLSAVFA